MYKRDMCQKDGPENASVVAMVIWEAAEKLILNIRTIPLIEKTVAEF